LPAHGPESVSVDGKKLAEAPGLRFLRMDRDRAVLEIGSGNFRFATRVD
jgi:hypothetical protein